MKAYGFIYLTTNIINGNKYIGQCKYEQCHDWQTYLGSGKHLKAALKKHSKENFVKEILCNAFTKSDLDYLEIHFISEYNATEDRTFYNIAPGGNSTSGFKNKKHSDETKAKISERCQQREITDRMRKHCSNLGKTKTLQQIEKHRSAISGEHHFRAKVVTVDGVEYLTITAARLATGMTAYKLRKLILDQ
jgi:group I intron endonuclease